MRNKMLRSVLVAAFSAVVALGALSGFSDEERETRANTQWPAAAASGAAATDNTQWPSPGVDGAGS